MAESLAEPVLVTERNDSHAVKSERTVASSTTTEPKA